MTDIMDRMFVIRNPNLVAEEIAFLRARVAEDKARRERRCAWSRDGEDSDTWATRCGHYFTLNEGTPSDNQMSYCPFCSAEIDATVDEDAPA